MRRLSLITLALVCALPAGAAAASDAPPLSAKVTSCTTGVAPGERAATFTGSMPALRGTRSMQMRFVLLQRRGSRGRFKPVVIPTWGTWETSAPRRAGFVFTKRIDALLAPAAYKAAIYFRWRDRRNRTQRLVHRMTRTCEQPDVRPELVFAALGATTLSDSAVYTVAARNDGRSTAAPFTVTLSFDGGVRGSVVLGPLDAGEYGQGAIRAPRCAPGATVTVTVDSDDVVNESDEGDNVVQRPCPLG